MDINAICNFAFECTFFDAAVCHPGGWTFGNVLLKNSRFDRRIARKHIAHALVEGEDETAELLLPVAYSSTLLHLVERSGQIEAWRVERFVRRLLQRQEIDVNATDSYGRRPSTGLRIMGACP